MLLVLVSSTEWSETNVAALCGEEMARNSTILFNENCVFSIVTVLKSVSEIMIKSRYIFNCHYLKNSTRNSENGIELGCVICTCRHWLCLNKAGIL